MIKLVRNSQELVYIKPGVFGRLELKEKDGTIINLFTKEKHFIGTKKWPFGKPMDSSVSEGTYDLMSSYSELTKKTEIFLYNPKNGVTISSADIESPIQRYGCIFTYMDITELGEGCIQLGMDVASKNSEISLTDTVKAYKIFRRWKDDNLDINTIRITSI